MHAPTLLNKILSIKYLIDTTPSELCGPFFLELDELMGQLQCATKWPEERLKKVILLRYIQYASEQATRLTDAPQQMTLTETAPSSSPTITEQVEQG